MMYSDKKAKLYHFYLAVAYVFLIPFFLDTAKIVVALMIINWLVSGTFVKKYKRLLQPIPLIFIGFYVVNLLGLIYTEDLQQGLAKVETKLLLFVFPLLLFTFGQFSKKQIRTILLSFVLGVFTASLIFFFHAIYFHPSIAVAFSKSFHWTHIMGYHRAFTSLQMAMSFFVVLYYFIEEYSDSKFGKKTVVFTYLLYSFVFVFLMSSRMEIIALSVVFLIAIIVYFYIQQKILKGVGYALIASLLIGVIAVSIPGAKHRLSHTIESIFKPKTEKQRKTGGDIRPIIWASAVEIIRENPLIGIGTGDVQLELNEKYIKNGAVNALKSNLTVHNQFIQMTVSFGVVGLLAFLGITIFPFFLAIKKRKYLYLIFLALFIIANMTESMLEKQEGILYFAFFNSFFALGILSRENNGEKGNTDG